MNSNNKSKLTKSFILKKSKKISTYIRRETNINTKFIIFSTKSIDFPNKSGYIIYASVSTLLL